MAATTFASLITSVRTKLLAEAASDTFWTDAEIAADLANGCKDLWRAILDLNQEHFFVIDETNVSLQANTNELTGVPNDVYRVHLIEPRDTTVNGASRNVLFIPRDYNSPEFQYGRATDPLDPGNTAIIYWCAIGQGSPAGITKIVTAPKVTTTVLVRLAYYPTLPVLTKESTNPCPGESDNALIAWGIAYSKAKENPEHAPDPNWLAIYGSEKQNMLTSLTPRQDQEPDVVPGFFEFYQSF